MILIIEKLQEACKNILAAVDNNELSTITETLELITEDNYLNINVTNREYFAQVRLDLEEKCDFHATVNAMLFLKLISQTTTETIDLNVVDNYVVVKGNGIYKLPLIFDGDKLLKLPEIKINNVTNSFNIKSSILKSILNYNSKELTKNAVSVQPVQKLYYVDEKGAITFTNGACVNNFELEAPVKLLLNNRLVKLFKLFNDEQVRFTLGYDSISDDIIQTKVCFESEDIKLTAILSCDDSLLRKFPVDGIRARANNNYPYSVSINKDMLLQAINRMLLFNSGKNQNLKPYSTMELGKDSIKMYDNSKINSEEITYNKSIDNMESTYVAILDLIDFKLTLEGCNEQYVNINFGDNTAFVITRGMVANVIPEIGEN